MDIYQNFIQRKLWWDFHPFAKGLFTALAFTVVFSKLTQETPVAPLTAEFEVVAEVLNVGEGGS